MLHIKNRKRRFKILNQNHMTANRPSLYERNKMTQCLNTNLKSKCARGFKHIARKWRHCQQGQFAISGAFIVLALLGATALSVDTINAYNARTDLQANLDGAVISSAVAASNPSASASDIESAGQNHFLQNFANNSQYATVDHIDINYDLTSREITANAQITIATKLFSIFGKDLLTITGTSKSISNGSPKPMDIALMLDVSGSMDGPRLTALKDAVEAFSTQIIGPGAISLNNRIALAPFSSSINAGPYADILIGGISSENCVAERLGPTAFTNEYIPGVMFDVDGEFVISNDENAGIYRDGYFDGYPSSPGLELIPSSTACSASELTPLTGDYSEIMTALGNFDAQGITAGHLGVAFSWYLISEEWSPLWPIDNAPGPIASTDKIVILMSDGMFNTYYQSTNGLPDEQTEKLCDNMKASSVTIYSIAFDFDGDSKDILRNCASSSDKFHDANTSNDLIDAFKQISQNITTDTIRITQ